MIVSCSRLERLIRQPPSQPIGCHEAMLTPIVADMKEIEIVTEPNHFPELVVSGETRGELTHEVGDKTGVRGAWCVIQVLMDER